MLVVTNSGYEIVIRHSILFSPACVFVFSCSHYSRLLVILGTFDHSMIIRYVSVFQISNEYFIASQELGIIYIIRDMLKKS
jgi:putative component of membrane protein insertase Oxa1/YidC/SpoIIIJ protein YidD